MKKNFRSFFDGQITILCGLYVTAKGAVLADVFGINEFEKNDSAEPIFKFPIENPELIMESIKKYNSDKPYCVDKYSLSSTMVNKQLPKYDFNTHPNPDAAVKALKSRLLMGNKNLYHLRFGKYVDMTLNEVAEYVNSRITNFPEEYKKTIEANKMSGEEKKEILYQALKNEYGDYVQQTKDIEEKIKSEAIESIKSYYRKIELPIVQNSVIQPIIQLSAIIGNSDVKDAISELQIAIDELSTNDIDLTNEEIAEIYSRLAFVDIHKDDKKLQKVYSDMLDSSIERIVENKISNFINTVKNGIKLIEISEGNA